MSRSLRFKLTSLSTVAWVWLGLPNAAKANSQGGMVVAGSATINPAASTVTINQASQNAIINWQSFNVRTDETVVFNQPNAQSSTLNRIIGNEGASLIDGNITANGRVFIINPDGIVFGKGAVVNVGGLVATTHSIADADFMAGNYNFTAGANPSASVVNQGQITAAQGGFAALVAPAVRNSGVITARLGTVALGAGNAFTLDFYGDRLINLAVSGDITNQVIDAVTGKPVSSLVANAGTVSADGGTVILAASTAKAVVDDVINISGVIEATSVGQSEGTITLSAPTASTKSAGAPVQSVAVSGMLNASGLGIGERGGTISVTGETVALTGATLDASGDAGGGTVLLGGDFGGGNPDAPAVAQFGRVLQPQPISNATTVTADAATIINASASASGNGGNVAVWSDGGTTYSGTIYANGGAASGNGGFVETSGKSLSIDGAHVSVASPSGKAGTWLLDPADYVIDSTAAATIEASLATGNVAVTTDASGTGGNGDIVLNSSLTWQANTTLLLDAYHSVQLNDNITASGNGAGLAIATNDGGTGGYFLIAPGATVNLTGTSPTLSINGAAYTLLRTASDVSNFLSSITTSTSGNYAIANDIDLSALNYAYNANVYFTGNLNGLGHTLNGFSQQGLAFIDIVGSNGSISNLFFSDASIASINAKNFFLDPTSPEQGLTAVSGHLGSGLLVGSNAGTIYNVYVSGTITSVPVDGSNIGGVAGYNDGTIFNSSANVTITVAANSEYVGGLVGFNGGAISTSFSQGVINGPGGAEIGGLVGLNVADGPPNQNAATGAVGSLSGGIIENSYSLVNLTLTSAGVVVPAQETGYGQATVQLPTPVGVGGLVGVNADAYSSGTIINSFSAGNVTVDGKAGGIGIGGLVGLADNSEGASTISDSFSTSVLSATALTVDVGSLVGASYISINTASTGSNNANSSVNTPSQATAAAGWDFTNIWVIGANGLPVLRALQAVTPGAAPAPASGTGSGGGSSGGSSGTGTGSSTSGSSSSGNDAGSSGSSGTGSGSGDGTTGTGGSTGTGSTGNSTGGDTGSGTGSGVASGGSSGGSTPAEIQQFLNGGGYGVEGLPAFNLYNDPISPLNVNDQGQIQWTNWTVFSSSGANGDQGSSPTGNTPTSSSNDDNLTVPAGVPIGSGGLSENTSIQNENSTWMTDAFEDALSRIHGRIGQSVTAITLIKPVSQYTNYLNSGNFSGATGVVAQTTVQFYGSNLAWATGSAVGVTVLTFGGGAVVAAGAATGASMVVYWGTSKAADQIGTDVKNIGNYTNSAIRNTINPIQGDGGPTIWDNL
ncbi:MAG: filamentous hemagglutinin N-terminal domain-containing protein [Bradyrhizobium sp.]|nr:filamentous hemagglutinin N-terminal domain-containing protein [Bradyrhizobium sp.]